MKQCLVWMTAACLFCNFAPMALAQTKDAVFKGAQLLTLANGKSRKEKVRLRMTSDALVIESGNGKVVIQTLPYADITRAEHQVEETDDDFERTLIGGGVFMGGLAVAQLAEKSQVFGWPGLGMTFIGAGLAFPQFQHEKQTHWLRLKTAQQSFIIRLSGRNYSDVMRALQLAGNLAVTKW